MKEFGFAMGRYEIADLSGIDVLHRVNEEKKLAGLIELVLSSNNIVIKLSNY